MKTDTPDYTCFGPLNVQIREDVRTLIKWGYEGARVKCRSTSEEEPSITGYIRQAIQARLSAPDCPDWGYLYSVHDDPPVEKEGRRGKARPRADIIIEAHFRGRPEYIFEAKRLRNKGYGVNRYIATDGMGCLIEGIYARRYDEAAMLGYVQSDTVEYWSEKVRLTIINSSSQLHLVGAQENIQITSDFPLEWVSEHGRISVGRNIKVHHILLDFR